MYVLSRDSGLQSLRRGMVAVTGTPPSPELVSRSILDGGHPADNKDRRTRPVCARRPRRVFFRSVSFHGRHGNAAARLVFVRFAFFSFRPLPRVDDNAARRRPRPGSPTDRRGDEKTHTDARFGYANVFSTVHCVRAIVVVSHVIYDP